MPQTALDLIRINANIQNALEQSPEAFEEQTGGIAGESYELIKGVVGHTLGMKQFPEDLPWGGYLVVDADSRDIVGTCGFKGGPNPEGAVEIAYFTFPQFEGHGYATRMAAEVIKLARSSEDARQILANTLPETNASTRILEINGLNFVGEVTDPEDGQVWQWNMMIRE